MTRVQDRWPYLLLPDAGDVICIVLLQWLLFHAPSYIFSDGSTGWHLIVGQYILQNWSIPRTDLISYTFEGAPWVAYEWLSDLMMACAHALAGLNGVAVLIAVLIALLFLLLYERCRAQGCHFALSAFLIVVGAIASSVHWLARPHIFTMLGVYLYLGMFESFRKGIISGTRLSFIIFTSMVLWVNLHPGFLFGFVITAIYLACDLAACICLASGANKDAALSRARQLSALLGLAFIASVINPYGINLYNYIGRYLTSNAVLAATNEYESPVFHGALQPTCFEILLLLLVVSLALSKKRPSVPLFAVCLFFAAMSLSAVRHIPLFVIAVVPLIAELLASSSIFPALPNGEPKPSPWWQGVVSSWQRVGANFDRTESRCKDHLLLVLAVAALIIAAVNGGSLFGTRLLACDFNSEQMPTATLACVKTQKLPATAGFNFDNWGGYIRYRAGIPVFIDDRADFYNRAFYLDYGIVSTVSPGWSSILDRYKIEWVLFPRNSQLAARLLEEPGWRLSCQDAASFLIVRRPPHNQ